MRKGSVGHRLLAVFVFGCLMLNAPLLSIFDKPVEVLGLPLLYVYVFAVWIGLIGLIAWIIEGR